MFGVRPTKVAAEPPPEISTLRLIQFPSGCQGPLYMAEELLRGEGFTDVQYIRNDTASASQMIQARGADLVFQFSAPFITEIDRSAELVTLGGDFSPRVRRESRSVLEASTANSSSDARLRGTMQKD
jgi:NitT/TauT family transport system substrate-binding protein